MGVVILPAFILVALLVSVLKGRGTPADQWRFLVDSLRSHPLLWLLLAISMLSVFLGFFWTVNFFVADSPAQALALYGKPLPDGWEAGVMNHGEYFKWYSISGHPVFFAASLTFFGGAIGLFAFLHKRLGFAPNQRLERP
jgi:hypothetical protein